MNSRGLDNNYNTFGSKHICINIYDLKFLETSLFQIFIQDTKICCLSFTTLKDKYHQVYNACQVFDMS
jgi:hypothetical protein